MKTNQSLPPEFSKEKLDQHYHLVLEILPDIVYRIDTEGKFLYISKSIQSLGWTPEELLGNHFRTIVHPEDTPGISRELVVARKKQDEPPAFPPKLFDERRTGERMTKWLEFRMIPKGWSEKDPNKHADSETPTVRIGELAAVGVYETALSGKRNYAGTVGIIRDITEKKQEQQAREKLQQQFLQAQKLESIGLLAGGIAHDFKNLLTIATGYLEVARDQGGPDNPFAVHMTRSLDALHRSRELTERLLGFSRGEAPAKVPIDLHAVLRSTAEMVTGPTNVTLDFDFSEECASVPADEGQISQVFENLIGNAGQAMDHEGKLKIQTVPFEITHRSEIPLSPGAYVRIDFIDSGPGIPQETLERIFDPFFTTKHGGTGLGLATSYFIAKKHGGFITAQSTGHGAHFSVFLPRDS